MDESTIAQELASQGPSLAIFASIIGLIVKAFLAHLKAAATEHKEAMVEVVKLTSDALAKNSEAIFEQSRLVGATLQALKDKL